MKVDKGVCTNSTLEDLNRAIQFEAVFSTLVENKILAIKRECELKKRHKKTRLLRRILFGRKVSGTTGGCCTGQEQLSASNSHAGIGAANATEPSQCLHGHNGTAVGADGISGPGRGSPEEILMPGAENSTISDGVDEVIVEIGDLSSLVDADGNVVLRTNVAPGVSGEPGSGPLGGQRASSSPRRSSDVARGSGSMSIPRKSSLLEPVSIEIEPESDPLSPPGLDELDLDSGTHVSIELDGVSDVSDVHRRSIASEPISIIKNATRSRFGGSQHPGPYLSAGYAASRLRVLEAKSISAQNSPVLPRQKPAAEGRHLTFSTATYQQPASTKACPIDCDTSFVVDLSQSDREQQQQQQQQQHQHNSTVIVKDKSGCPSQGRGAGGNGVSKKSVLVLGDISSSSSASKRNKLTQHLISGGPAYSGASRGPDGSAGPSSPPPLPQLGLIESFNQLTASNLPVISAKLHTARQSPPVSDTVKLQQQQQHFHHRPSSTSISNSPCRSAAIDNFVAPDQHSPLPARKASGCSGTGLGLEGGLGPVKASGGAAPPQQQQQNQRKQQRSFLRQSSCDVELHYRPSTVSTAGNRRSSAKENHHHHHRKGSGHGCYGEDYSSYIMGYDINESDEEKLNKRKYKYLKRCSDPVIVFPSTSSGAGASGGGSAGGGGGSGLQHCILSRPPNQPLQFPYDDDFMYDVSLQIESDRHGELDSIVPEHRRKHKHRHHHHHHRHCKKKRHKKRKILVHDLDDQSVKVIDPDDLPQRARWTIIATACLLLIMCLLLVGITLRMAPIIDDMVRQENERLMRESLDRAKMIKNYTEYNRMIGGDEIP